MGSSIKGNTQNLFAFKQNNADKLSSLKKKLSDVYGINSGSTAQNASSSLNTGYGTVVKRDRITAADLLKKKSTDTTKQSGNNGLWGNATGTIKSSDMAKSYKDTSRSSANSGNASSLVEAAKKYIGTAYVWGGDSKADGGLDCSGFVYNALKDSGKNVGRTTAQGYRQGGTKVDKNNLQPGDLVFFGEKGKASHVGIYAGNGQIIHSSGSSKNTKSNPGKGVSIASLNYRDDFLEARRY